LTDRIKDHLELAMVIALKLMDLEVNVQRAAPQLVEG
jgi:hypothetical protein